MELVLERETFDPEFTLGCLYGFGQRLCYTCEDCVRGDGNAETVLQWKIPGKSAIPYGRYKVVITYSQRFQKHLPLLLDVPGFAGVRLHGGNSSEDSSGCPLLGLALTRNGVKTCAPAVKKVMDLIQESQKRSEEIWLTVMKAA